MCKILVISDVHGRLRDLRWVLQNETADAMFYLGDGLYDLNAALELRREPVPYPIYRVAGNCDVNYSEPSEGLAPFGGVLFFYTHGHHYGVKMGSERLAECAGERGADVDFAQTLLAAVFPPDFRTGLSVRHVLGVIDNQKRLAIIEKP